MQKIFIFFLFVFLIPGCSNGSGNSVKVVNWNVQTFFDANTEGTEYSEFKSQKNWGIHSYETRLDRLCDVIKELNADIFVFEEIENQDVLHDITNKLADFSWAQKKNWNYATFSKNKGDSIGCGVLSRFPIGEISIHNLDIRTENLKQPSMRPIMQMKINLGGQELTLFVNHWKSKSGGAEESEVWRDWQEKLLARLVKNSIESGEYVLASGDFNRDINEFNIASSSYQNVLLDDTLLVHSAWIYESGKLVEPGSYYYQNEWSRIDHFFVSFNVRLTNFKAEQGNWCNDDGTPNRYKIYNNTGYSDHLPISGEILLE